MSEPSDSSTPTPPKPPEPPEPPEPRALPQPIIERRRWPIALIWAVPLIALLVAGYYYRDRWLERGGMPITLQLADAHGIKLNETPVSHRGVPVGKVTGLELSPQGDRVLAHVRLQRGCEAFARKGATYWIVRPEVSAESVSGLATLFSGPYIECNAGTGDPASEFRVQPSAPVATGEGVRYLLHAPRRQSIQAGSPIYYHGVQVGVAENVRLSDDAVRVDISIFIRKRYAPLVRTNSVFWTVGGADIQGGLFTGVRVRVESLRSLLAGGIAFATPTDEFGPTVNAGADFQLYDQAKADWPLWSPKIALAPIAPDEPEPAW
jgi:paraquat-inducible protein B